MTDYVPTERQSLRTSGNYLVEATLPAAGAYTDTNPAVSPFVDIVDGSDFVTCVVKYTGTGSGGNYKILPEWHFKGLGTAIIRHPFVELAGGSFVTVVKGIAGPGVTDTATYHDHYALKIPSGAVACRFRIAETGIVGAPGAAALWMFFRKD